MHAHDSNDNLASLLAQSDPSQDSALDIVQEKLGAWLQALQFRQAALEELEQRLDQRERELDLREQELLAQPVLPDESPLVQEDKPAESPPVDLDITGEDAAPPVPEAALAVEAVERVVEPPIDQVEPVDQAEAVLVVEPAPLVEPSEPDQPAEDVSQPLAIVSNEPEPTPRSDNQPQVAVQEDLPAEPETLAELPPATANKPEDASTLDLDPETARKLKVLRRLSGPGKTDAVLLAQLAARGAAGEDRKQEKKSWWRRGG